MTSTFHAALLWSLFAFCPAAGASGGDAWMEIRILECDFRSPTGGLVTFKTDVDTENRLHDAIHFAVSSRKTLIFDRRAVSAFEYDGNHLLVKAADRLTHSKLEIQIARKGTASNRVDWQAPSGRVVIHPSIENCKVASYDQAGRASAREPQYVAATTRSAPSQP